MTEAPAGVAKASEMKWAVRPAVREDCEAMLKLIVELAVFEREPEAVTVSLKEMQDCGFGAQQPPLWKAFVAEEQRADGTRAVFGMALYYYRYSTWKGRMIYLEDFIVSEPYRGVGAGRALFERVRQQAMEERCCGMMWQALEWNETALNFYRKYGSEFDGEWVNCKIMFQYDE